MMRYILLTIVLVACGGAPPPPTPAPAVLPPEKPEKPEAPVGVMKPDPEPVGAKAPPVEPQKLCPSPVMDVRFSPRGDCTEGIVTFIGSAKKTIRVQAYSFTSEPIAEALVKAKARGIDVVVLLDKSNATAKASKLKALQDGKVPAFIDSKHAIAHDKVIIVDGASVETGSFNYSNAAEESNAENCLFMYEQKDIAKAYTTNWNEHKGHATAPGALKVKQSRP